MIELELFAMFARIGAVTFGGGYAMVPLIERELSDRGWLTASELADIVAVSQTTPGPLALNVATYVGRQVAGVSGALVASLGLAAPAVAITALALFIVRRGGRWRSARAAVRGVRSAVLGLIATAVLFFLETSVILGLPRAPVWREPAGSYRFSVPAALVFLAAFILARGRKPGPIPIMLGAALAGFGAYAIDRLVW